MNGFSRPPLPRSAPGLGNMPDRSGGHVTAVLGPTNTGKTYLAIERMMGHASGMMGFPLRLLARENYDRVVAIKGADAVALVTGEEKILPPNPSYFLCTVESMPLAREVAFLAVDEVQLAADPDRGHIFTDRILNARGYAETMLLGAETIAPFIRALVPGCEFISRPRFSSLSYGGVHKITRLPARSAIVAFSAASVYGIAELLRRQRGGAAVVMGALSPRTRNAQVAMFQDGEVDYLVATDAIGMGLNMDVAHVAFGELSKFDGHRRRPLIASELGQVAGRAGRHMANGTFGTTVEAGELAPELIAAIEDHSFGKLHAIRWRNSDLVFNTLGALMASLDLPSPMPGLVPVRDAPDHLALKVLGQELDIADSAQSVDDVRRLWDVCQIPDFRRAAGGGHARFLTSVYRRLIKDHRLNDDWINRNITRLDRADGDIETLTGRIDHIRTWTYIAHRADWLGDAGHWQGRTRAVEDRLSDALHDRLTQRFVDRRTTALVRGLKGAADLTSEVAEDGDITVEGHVVGRIEGFRFAPRHAARKDDDSELARKAVRGAAARALAPEIARRLDAIAGAGASALALGNNGHITWRGALVGSLAPGRDGLSPVARPVASDVVDAQGQARLAATLQSWLDDYLRKLLGPLYQIHAAAAEPDLAAPVRGILFQLAERFGCVAHAQLAALVRQCDASARKALARFGVRLGTQTIYVDGLHGAAPRRLRAILDGIHRRSEGAAFAVRARAVGRGAPDFSRDADLDDDFYRACGLVALGPRVLAAPRAEALAAEARKLARQGVFTPTPALRKLAGGSVNDLVGVLLALGFKSEDGPAGLGFAPTRAARPARRRTRSAHSADGAQAKPNVREAPQADAHSPEKAAPKPPRRKKAKGAMSAASHAQRAAREARRMEDSPFAVLRQLKLRSHSGSNQNKDKT
jgi:ATP-dependent RNA helicase SUPV3L1/SUV3